MYKISVPIMNSHVTRAGREKLAEMLKKIGAQRVFLALDSYVFDGEERRGVLETLRDNSDYFKAQGFETGAWIWTFRLTDKSCGYTYMESPFGKVSQTQVCPSDPEFRRFAGEYIKDIARCGVQVIMFDDDFRYGYIDIGMGCTCKNHLARMSSILGEEISKEGLAEKLLSGGPNKYRSAWLKANGDYFREFAAEMRACLDEVDPSVRFGPCSCMPLWDFDGVSTPEISRILAGSTRPFMRLIGAPYWSVNKGWGNRLQDVIELERMERSWSGEGIEIFSEGDVYPRPRFTCSAARLEGFDTALRAAGCMDGILKYVMDYTSNAGYETGYVERHIRNQPLYEGIERHFAGKDVCGVRVYESMCKFENAEIPEEVAGTTNVQDMFFSPAARLLAGSSFPTVYEGPGTAGIAFGENAKYLPDGALDNGLILDARAAQILSEQGVDVGVERFGEKFEAEEERFLCCDEYTCPYGAKAYELTLRDGAETLSVFTAEGREHPAAFRYENAAGQRFLVFAFNGYFSPEVLFRQYTRSKQIADCIEWLCGKKLPAFCFGNPDLYTICKRDANSLSVGLWNFFEDSVPEPVVTLDRAFSGIEFLNCSGRLEGDKVYLSEIPPFDFAGFTVK